MFFVVFFLYLFVFSVEAFGPPKISPSEYSDSIY